MNYYFVSDIHLGLKMNNKDHVLREKMFVAWLNKVEEDLTPDENNNKKGALFLLGDIFDFWFEYRRVVPKGFVRTLYTLSKMCERGIEIHFFVGNHDTWCYDYFEKEIGIILHKKEEIFDLCGKKCLLSHGHNLKVKPINYRYHFMINLFNNKIAYNIYSWLVHPDINIFLGSKWSELSKKSKALSHSFKGEEEICVRYSREYLKHTHIDYFIFGHFHTPIIYSLSKDSNVVVLDQWVDIDECLYAVLNDNGISINNFSI